jgi:hypothetical protein
MQVADDKKVKAIYALFEADIEESKRTTLKQYNQELEAADKEIANGSYITHSSIIKRRKRGK